MSEFKSAGGDSKERVAFDVMMVIASQDIGSTNEIMKDRKGYFLRLYAECLGVVSGVRPPAKQGQ